MALHNLKIIVYDGGKASSGKFGGGLDDDKSESGGTGKKSLLYKVLNYNSTIREKMKQTMSPTTFFAVQQGISLAVQMGREAINYYVSDIGRRNGDSNHQAIVNRRIEKVSDMLSIGQGALGGAAAGSAVGLLGAVIGFILGAASPGINLGFKYAERERAYQHEMFELSNNQAYQLARASYSALTGRVR